MSLFVPPLPPQAAHFQQDGWWPNRTLLDFFDEAVDKTPDKIAIVANNGCRLTYSQAADAAANAAQALFRAGLRAGDVISLQLPNCAEFVVAHLAATRLGAVTNPLLPNYRANELGYILAAARTKIVVTIDRHRGFDFTGMYNALRPALPELLHIFTVNCDAPDFRRCEGLFEKSTYVQDIPDIQMGGNELASLIFTSGTESKPKGVMHSHNTMLYGTLRMAKELGLTADDVIWIPSPIGHGTGFQWGVRQSLMLGATMVLQDHWAPEEGLRLIEAERCSFVLSATPFVAALADAAESGKYDVSSLRIFGCAGAPIPRQLGAMAEARLGCALIGMWGMSECFVASTSSPSDSDEKRWGSDGRAMPGGELAIFDETRTHRLPPGEVGELAARGPFVALGYFNDPERTAATFSKEGWLFSGDLATIDEDGFIRLVGRMKDIVNRGGLKVSTKEIEDLLLLHPSVTQAAVVPVSDEKLGEKGCACIILDKGAKLSFPEMIAYLEQHEIATYKLPEALALLDELPFTASGKIQKSVIRQRIEQGEIAICGRPVKPTKKVEEQMQTEKRAGIPADMLPRMESGSLRLLQGIRVVDLTTSLAGPYATMMLADLGADVIKIERPGIGDDSRHWRPPVLAGKGLWFSSVNRSKRSITLDYANDAGRAVLYELIARSDVIVTNQLPKVLSKLKIDVAAIRSIKPDIVFVSVTGFGLEGERANEPCYDIIAEGYSGVMDLTGEWENKPQKVGTAAADLLAGADAAFGCLAALFDRKVTGRGHLVDVSLAESMIRFMTPKLVSYLGSGDLPRRTGATDSVIAIYQVFQAEDEPLTLGLANDNCWVRFCKAVGRDDLLGEAALADNEGRVLQRARLQSEIAAIIKMKPRDYWLALFAREKVPAGPINRLDEVASDPEFLKRQLFYTVDDAGVAIPQVGLGIRFDNQIAGSDRAPPDLGQHTEEVLTEILGYAPARIDGLRQEKLI